MLPLAGGIYGSLLSFTSIVIAYFILDWFFNYGFRDFIVTVIIYGLSLMLINQLTVLVAGTLYNAFM